MEIICDENCPYAKGNDRTYCLACLEYGISSCSTYETKGVITYPQFQNILYRNGLQFSCEKDRNPDNCYCSPMIGCRGCDYSQVDTSVLREVLKSILKELEIK